MNNPTVCAVMLTKDRPAMARRAVECFDAQTYPEKRLLVVNTGECPLFKESPGVEYVEPCFIGADALSIGELRNLGTRYASDNYTPSWTRPEIFIHWDDDDWSHPNRITEQVALLQASGADAVGYNELLFWRTRIMIDDRAMPDSYGEAWLYTNRNQYYAVGTSLCYWRKTWERKPFADLPRPEEWKGEDKRWIDGLNVTTDSGMGPAPRTYREPPRLIARIHSGNTMAYDIEGQMEKGSQEWRRVPEWDAYCKGVFA